MKAQQRYIVPPEPDAAWEKVLFLRQDYPDNHVDDSFLASLVTNGARRGRCAATHTQKLCHRRPPCLRPPLSAANIQPYEYWSVVRSAAVFLQQISTLIVFVVRAPRQMCILLPADLPLFDSIALPP